ncbi:GNAT family N-acetyltransferase [Roseisalinus antarcticus]|nr:GNAT family N-acetyltransferase [Roseisalinus antarcticus]
MARILKHWVTATRWMPDLHTPDQDRAFLAEQVDSAELVVADHGRIAGFVVRHGTDITMLYVAETARRLGVGSALLNRMRRDHPRLSLWTFQPNAEARAFYAARGGAGGRAHGEPRQRRTRAGCPAGLELT